MLTERERIANLEADMVEAKSGLAIAAAFTINAIQSILDQMVDEGALAATTRSEIFERIRNDVKALGIGSELVAKGARAAMPHYPTKTDAAELKHRESQMRASDERVRREKLGLQPAPTDTPKGER